MGNQVPFSTVYFCGNCEDELVGLPAGSRVASGRPLCKRCTEIGVSEGWGEAHAPAPTVRIYESTGKRGIILLLFMMALTAIVVFVVNAFSNSAARRY